jgi:REP element-mobilizing transposase RayT
LNIAETGGVTFAADRGDITVHNWAGEPAHQLQTTPSMARQLRLERPGAVYHVMSRGNAKQAIYLDDEDRRAFLDTLWRVCERLDWRVWAFCLMPNHYHLLLQIADSNLSRGMRDLNGLYSMTFNARHERVGHVFQGRFKSLLVDKESYLLEVSRYIMLNPVRSGLCRVPEEWLWSSYRATVGLTSAPLSHLAVKDTLASFDSNPGRARAAFIAFMQAALAPLKPPAGARVPSVLGTDAFVANVARDLPAPSTEVPRAERALKSLLDYSRENPNRDDAILAAYASGNHTQAAIARYFGLHYGSVCRILRNRSCRDVQMQDVTP